MLTIESEPVMIVIIKRYFWKALLIPFLLANSTLAKPQVIDWKNISDKSFNGADLFIDKNNRVFVEVAHHYLWQNNNLGKTDQYGQYFDGFIKDGKVCLAFTIIDKPFIDIYTVGENIAFEKRITISGFPPYHNLDQIIYVPEDNNVFYLLGSIEQLPRNPVEFMYDVVSGGHGIYYTKPVWAEIQGQKCLGYQKIPYGGRIDESYYVREVLTGEDTIHFFGFRTQEKRTWRDPPTPQILYYAACNVKKGKVVYTQDIYEKVPYSDPNNRFRGLYWHVSADNFNDNLFVVFSWNWTRGSSKSTEIKMENIDTPIYYSQKEGASFGNVETIGNGILPLVRTDTFGNAHVIWSDSKGNLVHKAKKGGRWSDEQIILSNVIDTTEAWEGMRQGRWWLQNMCAEFDKDNNLNLVFTSKGKLVYAKIILN